MALIEVENQDNIAILKLNNGITNALNFEFISALSDELAELGNDQAVDGIVLTSNNEKFFSIGFDLPQLYNQSIEEVTTFYKTYNRLCLLLYTIPKPTIAAIVGHAIAGGCILTFCCDYRLIAQGKKLMGVNEIKLGIPVPYPADRMLNQIIGPRNAQELMYTGEFYLPDQLKEIGLVDEILPASEVVSKAKDKIRLIGGMPKQAFGMIKRNRTESVVDQILNKLEEKEEFFLIRWETPEVKKLLKEAVEKF